jgi:CO/xanthine dehydrogenase Mo-binding subunit
MTGADMTGPQRQAGRSVRRMDFAEKVNGTAKYCVDLAMEGMLHARVVRSDRAHATILAVHADTARSAPGVAAVLTGADLDDLFPRFGHIIPDHCILASGKVRYYGEPVALVVAETLFQAVDAAEMVTVDYEDLPAVMTAEQALLPGAPLVHEQSYATGDDSSFLDLRTGGEGSDSSGRSNVAHEASLEWGDVDAALAASFLVVQNETHFPMLYAYAMEPYNALASYRDGSLVVYSTAQHPFMVRDDLARIFALPLSRVRVISPYLGGGYGSKSYTKVEPMAAVASRAVGRPVKLVLSVEESIYTTRVDAARVRMRSGFDAGGKLLARDCDIEMDSGAYADNGPLVLDKAVNRCFGPYRVPHLRVRGQSVYTNTSPASSYRGFGAPQGALAGETNMDQAAERLGISPAEIRRRNLVGPKEELLPGKRPMDADLHADLALLTASLEEGALPQAGELYGIGFGCTASDAGAFPVSTATVRLATDGSVTVLSGSTEMGQGSKTVLGQIAAEELGVDLTAVQVVQSDTATTSYERTTGASRTTTLTGLAVQRACAEVRRKLRDMAAETFDCEADGVQVGGGRVRGPGGSDVSLGAAVTAWFGSKSGEVTGVGIVRRSGETATMPPFWEIGMAGLALAIDPETGRVRVDQLVTVGDVGFALNPQAVEGQDLGAATQGIGMALFEELVYDGPQIVNPNIIEYRVPKSTDLARRIDTILAQRGDGIGPYGAKGSGEGALNPMAPAAAAAVARATGRWSLRLPLTPERVWRLLHDNTTERA